MWDYDIKLHLFNTIAYHVVSRTDIFTLIQASNSLSIQPLGLPFIVVIFFISESSHHVDTHHQLSDYWR